MHCLVFGYGYMGRIRTEVLRRHPSVHKLTIVDPVAEMSALGPEMALLRPDEAIPWDACDAVFICTPNNVTAGLCIEALRRCGRVFCEKPPGRTWEEFGRIAEATRGVPGHTLVFGFNHRLHPSIQAAKALLAAGHTDVAHLKGGLPSWKQAGLPTKVDRKAPLPLMRQVQIIAGSLIVLGVVLGYALGPLWFLLSGFVGAGLLFAGVTGHCGMAMMLTKLPYNKLA